MNKLNLIIVMFFLANISHSDEVNKPFVDWTRLAKLAGESVKVYSGLRIDQVLVNQKPDITVNFIKVPIEKPQKAVLKPILIIRSGSPNSETTQVINRVKAISGLKVAVFRESFKKFDHNENNEGKKEREETDFIRFDFLNSSGVKQTSEWRYKKNGFPFRTASYDENGNLLSFTYYLNLNFNNDADDHSFDNFGPAKVIHLNKTKNYKNVVLKNDFEIEPFTNALIKKTFKLLKFNFREK